MTSNITKQLYFLPLIVSVFASTACSNKETAISYSNMVQPIFQKNCSECHLSGGSGEVKSGFNLSTYDSTLKGTKFGPVIIPGSSISSTLVILIENRADPSINMPHGSRSPLSKVDIQTIKTWIDQGAKNN